MTGHDLWVTTATVPMIAHYDLFHDKVTRTTSAMLLLWEAGSSPSSTRGRHDRRRRARRCRLEQAGRPGLALSACRGSTRAA